MSKEKNEKPDNKILEQAKTEEERKKLLAAQLLAKEEAKALEARRLAEEEDQKKKNQQGIGVRFLTPGDDWQKLVEDYKKEFNKEPDDKGVLIFPNLEAVLNFFTEQAKLGRMFLAAAITPEGKETGHYEFSCGDGKLYVGSFELINQQLQASLKQDPTNEKIVNGIKTIQSLMPTNPVHEARRELNKMKGESNNEQEPTPPSPLSTTR